MATPTAAQLIVNGTLTVNLSLGTVGVDSVAQNFTGANIRYGVGSGAGNFNQGYLSDRSVTFGTPDSLNLLSGALLDIQGNGVTIADIVGISIRNNATAGAGNLLVGAGTTPVGSMWGTAAQLVIPPGATFGIANPAASGYAVTPSTAMLLNVNASTGTLSYTIELLSH